MMQVNLLPWRQKQQRLWRWRWGAGLFCHVIAAVSLVCALCQYWRIQQQHLQALQNQLQQQYAVLQQQDSVYRLEKQQQTQRQQQRVFVNEIKHQNAKRHLRLVNLAKWTPQAIWLTHVKDDRQFHLQGYSSDYQSIVVLQDQLRAYGDFSHVELDSVRHDASKGYWHFLLLAQIKNEQSDDKQSDRSVATHTTAAIAD